MYQSVVVCKSFIKFYKLLCLLATQSKASTPFKLPLSPLGIPSSFQAMDILDHHRCYAFQFRLFQDEKLHLSMGLAADQLLLLPCSPLAVWWPRSHGQCSEQPCWHHLGADTALYFPATHGTSSGIFEQCGSLLPDSWTQDSAPALP